MEPRVPRPLVGRGRSATAPPHTTDLRSSVARDDVSCTSCRGVQSRHSCLKNCLVLANGSKRQAARAPRGVQSVTDAAFQKHGLVSRLFRVRSDDQVYRLKTCLMRWKCVVCGTTFRRYPPGVMPRKQYLPASLLGMCDRYVKEPHASYRQVTCSAGRLKKQPIFYAFPVARKESSERQKALEQTRVLAHSTLWQWLGFLAALWMLVRKRGERRQNTSDKCDLSPWAIHPGKYRSAERRQILIQALSTLRELAGKEYSTDFKTLYAGP